MTSSISREFVLSVGVPLPGDHFARMKLPEGIHGYLNVGMSIDVGEDDFWWFVLGATCDFLKVMMHDK